MRCLELVGSQGPLTAGRLAEESGLTTGAVTFILDRLEEAGMVTRRTRHRGPPPRLGRDRPGCPGAAAGPAAARRRGDARRSPSGSRRTSWPSCATSCRQAKEVFQRQVTGAVTGDATPWESDPDPHRHGHATTAELSGGASEGSRLCCPPGWEDNHFSEHARSHAVRPDRARRPNAVRLRLRPHARPAHPWSSRTSSAARAPTWPR